MAVCSSAFKPLKNWVRSSILLGLGSLLIFCSACHSPAPQPKATAAAPSCERLVSFSPSITEIVYALGLGNHLVGVTRFCKYPPDAQRKASVGGYLDPNIEAVVRLQPTLVILRKEQSDLKGRLSNFQRPTLTVEHRSVGGILQSIRQIGQVCHQEPQADRMVATLQSEITDITHKTERVKTRPRTLLVVDRDIRYNTVKNVFAAAHDGVFDWLITHAGAKNALQNQTSGFSELSAEGILRLNPDIIIELMPNMANSKLSQAEIQRAWQTMPALNAVKSHRIYLLTDDYVSIPGPRFVKTLRRFAETLHPELDWNTHGE